MRPCSMIDRKLPFILPLLLLAAACDRQEDTAAAPAPTPTATTASPGLDLGAIIERQDPTRVLRYYAAALAAGEWSAAAHAWGEESGITGSKLQAELGGNGPVTLDLGQGQTEGAAGSLYYEAPVTVRFGNGKERKGTIVLRRVNDVEGASDEQLRWHIDRSSFGPDR